MSIDYLWGGKNKEKTREKDIRDLIKNFQASVDSIEAALDESEDDMVTYLLNKRDFYRGMIDHLERILCSF